MSKLYLMRHGQTLFNVLRRKQGWCDSPLTELGIEQAREAAAWFRDQGIHFDHVYSSTSERSCDTAEIVAPGQPYERLKGLKEWCWGKFEGITEDLDIQHPYGDFYVQFGGESELQVRERISSTLLDIMRRPNHECVLAVSHGAAIRQVPFAFGQALADHLGTRRHMGNCAAAVFEFDGDSTLILQEIVGPDN